MFNAKEAAAAIAAAASDVQARLLCSSSLWPSRGARWRRGKRGKEERKEGGKKDEKS
jgi:hypothetical protein